MSITVSGNIKDLAGTAVTSAGTFVRFYMRGAAGNQPLVSGVALIPPTVGSAWYEDFVADVNGAVSGTLYSTSEVSCGGQTGVIWYGMQVFQGTYAGPEIPVDASANINITTPNILTVLPVVPAPTGDSTYARIDGANTAGGLVVGGVLNAVGTVTAPTFIGLNINGIRFASKFAGADLGAKINAASAAAGSNGVIYVDTVGTITTPLSLASGTTLTFGPGVFTINSGHTISAAGVKIRGAGVAATVLEISSATGDVFTVTGSSFELSGIQWRPRTSPAVIRTSGAVINAQNVEGLFRDCKLVDPFRGISLTADLADGWKIQNIILATSGGNWDYFIRTYAPANTVASTTLENIGGSLRGAVHSNAIFIFDSRTDTVTAINVGCEMDEASFPIWLFTDTDGVTGFPRWIDCIRCFGENNSGKNFDIQSGRNLTLNGDCYIGVAKQGITVAGATVSYVKIVGNHFTTIEKQAITLAAGSVGVLIENNTFDTIGYDPANLNTWSIVEVAANTSFFNINGNASSSTSANFPKFAVNVAAGSSGNFSISSNAWNGVAGGAYVNIGTLTGNNWKKEQNGSDAGTINTPGTGWLNATGGDITHSLGLIDVGKSFVWSLGNRDVKYDAGGTGAVKFTTTSGTVTTASVIPSTGALSCASIANTRTNITLANGANSDIALSGSTFVKIVGPSAVFNVTGFVGGTDGRILRLYNSVAFAMTITNNATSSAANRILTLTGADVVLRAGQSFATFIYDSAQSLWILTGTN